MSKTARKVAAGLTAADKCRHLFLVSSMGSCRQFCFILHPHRVSVPSTPTFASPLGRTAVFKSMQNSFVEGKIWDHPSKMMQK